MTEFVLVFPAILLLVIGIIEFSLLSNAHQVVNYASFCAARAMAVSDDEKIYSLDKSRLAAAIPCISIAPASVDIKFPDFMKSLGKKINRIVKHITSVVPDLVMESAFAYFFTDCSIQYFDPKDSKVASRDKASYVMARVTYYYNLKFQVISGLSNYVAKGFNKENIFEDTIHADQWEKARSYTKKTGVAFIPIVKECIVGIN